MLRVLYFQYSSLKEFEYVLSFVKLSSSSRYNYLNNFCFEKDKYNSALAYTMLCMGRKKSYLEILREKNNKPRLEDVFISISHTDGLVVVALSDFDIGIDCEKFGTVDDEIKNMIFSDNELKQSKNDDFRTTLFWTGKESLSKLRNEDWYSTKRTNFFIRSNSLIDNKNPSIYFYYKVVNDRVICLASEEIFNDIIFEEVAEFDLHNFCLKNIEL